jgi:hypothetical protein
VIEITVKYVLPYLPAEDPIEDKDDAMSISAIKLFILSDRTDLVTGLTDAAHDR